MNKELLFGIHCHQPVNNFSHVVDDAVKKCYLPFVKKAYEYPDFKFSIHFSGWLLEYIEKHSDELFMLFIELAKQNRVEFSSGGYYEPILASIPSRDRVDQIKKLNRYIEKKFKQKPTSLWLTERVWEDSIITDLKKCGIESVFVDDYHFFTAGFEDKNIDRYFVTENGGEYINVFPINKELRYAVPFKPVEELDGFFEDFFAKKSVGVLYDDGEKFGVWPGTHKWVYEDKWLEKFLNFLTENNIKTLTFSEYTASHKPKGIAYLPSVSYFEMGEWSLPAKAAFEFEALKEKLQSEGEDIDRFVKGGIWKNFLVKYYESNKLHKRVLGLSKIRTSVKSKIFEDALFRAECNDVFWHGVFGGLYLPNLRDNAYSFVAEAEDFRYKDLMTPTIFIEDINQDSIEDIKAVTKEYIAVFDMGRGGVMNELLLRDKKHNLQNTLSRYKESYHYKVSEAIEHDGEESHAGHSGIDSIHSMDMEKLKQYEHMFVFDNYTKNSFVDHVSDYSLSIENFQDSTFRQYTDLHTAAYDCLSADKHIASIAGKSQLHGEVEYDADIKKDFTFKNSEIDFTITFSSDCDYDLRYICEFNFHFLNQDDVVINGEELLEQKVYPDSNSIVLKDMLLKKEIVIEFENEVDFFVYRVDTLSQSESGFDATKQGYCIGAVYNYKNRFELSGSLKIKKAASR